MKRVRLWVVVATILGLATTALFAGHTAAVPDLRPVAVTASEFSFSPGQIIAAPAEELTINLENVGQIGHDMVFELDGSRTAAVPFIRAGERGSVTFTTPAQVGRFVYYCSVGSHRQLGMEGELVVEQANPTATPGALEPVASNLLSPRGLALYGENLLVSEGGTGMRPAMGFAPGDNNGQVRRISLTSLTDRAIIVESLANVVDPGGGVIGANHAIFRDPAVITGTTYVLLSGGPGHADPKAQVLAGTPGGTFSVLADLWAFEEQHNPDEGEIDSNPWRIAMGEDNLLYVTDAGGNDLVRVHPDTGATTLYAVFEPVGLNMAGNPISAVPTGLAFAPTDGGSLQHEQHALYVSLLGSFAAGESQVRKLVDLNEDGDALDEGENTLAVDGLSMAVDLAFSPGGNLYVIQFGGRPAEGLVKLVGQPGKGAEVGGLYAPSGLAFMASGDLLVSVAGAPGTFNTDRVVKVPAAALEPQDVPETPTPVATEESTPTTEPTPTTGPTATSGPPRHPIYAPVSLKDFARP
jgi:plastocyanin